MVYTIVVWLVWYKMKKENGFTIIEASWSMLLILSLIIGITYLSLAGKQTITEYTIQQYMTINYVKITEIFYNSKNNFEDDIKKMFNYQDNQVILTYDNKEYAIKLTYSEEIEKNIHRYLLKIEFPEKLKNLSLRYFRDLELMRWHYV